jgi:hypothetical protein
MSEDREDEKQPPSQEATGDQAHQQPGEAGAESYGGDPDAGQSVSEEEVEAGMERDQAEG